MIIRGGGAIGGAGFVGAEAWICVPLISAGDGATGGGLPACTTGVVVVTRGGTAIAGGAVLGAAAGTVAAGGVTGTLGGITTTAGGRCAAATEAGVTSLGGVGAGASLAGLDGAAFGFAGATGASAFASTAGVATGGLAAGRAAGRSATPFCCVMARSTSPGREICERSILVLISSSPRAAREVFAELVAVSLRPRRCFRTSSASCSSRELECVFFSVTPTVVSTSRISLLLTSSSRARSLIRILLIRSRFLFLCRQCRRSRFAYLTSCNAAQSYFRLTSPAPSVRIYLRTRHHPSFQLCLSSGASSVATSPVADSSGAASSVATAAISSSAGAVSVGSVPAANASASTEPSVSDSSLTAASVAASPVVSASASATASPPSRLAK